MDTRGKSEEELRCYSVQSDVVIEMKARGGSRVEVRRTPSRCYAVVYFPAGHTSTDGSEPWSFRANCNYVSVDEAVAVAAPWIAEKALEVEVYDA